MRKNHNSLNKNTYQYKKALKTSKSFVLAYISCLLNVHKNTISLKNNLNVIIFIINYI